MKERYTVKFNYLREDGITVIGKQEVITLNTNYNKQKTNHKLAEKQLLKLYPNAEIVSVSYV